jgi:RNA polymerase sigma-70 factor (ECF subfamily)
MTTTHRTGARQQQFDQLFHRTRQRAWDCFDRYNPERSFEGWLFRILTNRAIDLQRRRLRRPTYSLDAEQAMELIAPDSDPASICQGRFGEARLNQAIDQLPEHYRSVIRLYVAEQSSYQEVADTVQCAVGTVRSRVHRARCILRAHLE